ncbi:hypothetical protein [Ectobacillus funiculus]|uniref:Replication protein n=1 Tax=Ectobacillus funiculus TaxID=137993 RepID=A0ABV5WPA8_9BACI
MTNSNCMIYDQTTGEIVGAFDSNKQYIRSKDSDEAYKRYLAKQQERLQDKRHFSFADMNGIQEVIASISTVHCGYLLLLQCYMEFETGELALSRQEMWKALNVTESTFKRFWGEMRKYGIITESNSKYYVNPNYHFRGKTKQENVIKVFATPLKQIAKELTASELGFLYKLLPFVHYETNMICADPFSAPEQIQFLNKTQISRLVEMEEKKASRTIDKLRRAGVLAETTRQDDKRDKIYTLNPYIFFRKSGKPDDTLRGLFASTPYGK